MPIRIRCTPGDDDLPALLNRYYAEQGFLFEPLDPSAPIDADYVFLATPFRQADVMLTADSVWKKYLRIHRPAARLISVGFEVLEHSNYLFRFDLPPDLSVFLAQTLPCSAPWEPAPVPGQSAAQLLKRFYVGHGSDSILSSVSRLKTRITVIAEELAKNTNSQFIVDEMVRPSGTAAGLLDYWQPFKIRWDSYAPYFTRLPFGPRIEEGDHLIQSIHPYFAESLEDLSLFRSLDVPQKILRINDLIHEIGRYVE